MKDLDTILKELPDHDIPDGDHAPSRKHGPVKPDPAAIANLHALQANRPLKPPGRS